MLDARQSRRESDEAYHSIIHATDKWRVIACKDGRQWIVQRAKKTRYGRLWRGKSYCTSRTTLMRVWADKTGRPCAALGLLPETIGGQCNG